MTAAETIAALDEQPGDVQLLLDLGRAARDDDRWVDELFARFANALAAPGAERSRLRWVQVCHAALFGRLGVLAEALRDPDFRLPGDALRAAKVGGLLLDLGKVAEADQELAPVAHPLARYHRHRLAVRRGDRALAEELLAALPTEGPDLLLRRLARAADGLRAGDPARARKLVDWWMGPADMASTPSHLSAEMTVLQIELYLADGERDMAIGAAEPFATLPARFDPGAILRATDLLGPLPRRFR